MGYGQKRNLYPLMYTLCHRVHLVQDVFTIYLACLSCLSKFLCLRTRDVTMTTDINTYTINTTVTAIAPALPSLTSDCDLAECCIIL